MISGYIDYRRNIFKLNSGLSIEFNGYLTNADRLRKDLGMPSESGDADLIRAAYAAWGEECLSCLSGAYSFAIWDERRKALFAARDRMGVMPFFYTQPEAGTFVFGSGLNEVLRHDLVKVEIDEYGIADMLLLGPGRTPGFGVYKGISELAPGHYLKLTPDAFDIRRYWKLIARLHTDSFEETVGRVRHLLKQAVTRYAKSDAPACAFLSGGLDSSAIVAISGVTSTFSVDYEGNQEHFSPTAFQPDSDEAHIDVMKNAFGLKHTNIVLPQKALAEALHEAAEARVLPGMGDVDSSLMLFCREVLPHASVALSGECSDELFGGYPWFWDERSLGGDSFPWVRNQAYRESFTKAEALPNIDCGEYVRSRFEATVDDTDTLPGEPQAETQTKRMIRLNTDWFMQTLLERQSRMSMRLCVRAPFSDHELAEYIYSVPTAFRNHEGREKGLLREALRGILPESVLWRKKSPYPKTRNPLYTSIVSEMLSDLLGDPNAPVWDVIEKNAARGLLTSDNPQPWYGQLMTTPQTMAFLLQLNWTLSRKY